jgi:tripartite-type tricarboxylate transporter receptor subunit TctC
MGDPALKKQLEELGGAPRIETADAFNAEIAAETEKWKKVVEFSGLKID